MAILRRIKKTVMRAMCGFKITEKRRSQKLMSLLDLTNTLDGLARMSRVQWHGHVLRRKTGDVLRRALDFKVAKKEGVGSPI